MVKELIALEIEFVSSKKPASSFVDGPDDDERFSVHSTIDLILVVLKPKEKGDRKVCKERKIPIFLNSKTILGFS